jgi:hypothetical protein
MEKNDKDVSVSEEDRLYDESVRRIMNAVLKQTLSFGQAVKLIDVSEEGLKAAIIDDALKVLIAELHFNGGKTLKELCPILKLPLKTLEKAKAEMLSDVEEAAIEVYKKQVGEDGGVFGNA